MKTNNQQRVLTIVGKLWLLFASFFSSTLWNNLAKVWNSVIRTGGWRDSILKLGWNTLLLYYSTIWYGRLYISVFYVTNNKICAIPMWIKKYKVVRGKLTLDEPICNIVIREWSNFVALTLVVVVSLSHFWLSCRIISNMNKAFIV